MSLRNQLCISIYQAANKVSRVYGALLSPHGLTFPQYQVLVVLWDKGASTIGAIAAALSIDTSTITPVAKRLQSLGYVDRFRDRVDERKVYVSLTEQGTAFKEEAQALRGRLLRELGMPLAEFLELQRLLQSVSRSVDRMLGPPALDVSSTGHQFTRRP